MDSKNIYIACNSKIDRVRWEQGNDFYYVGISADFKKEHVQNIIDTHFPDGELYLVVDRKRSSIISKDQAVEKARAFSGEQDSVFLFDQSYQKVMEFNNVGSARHGEFDSNLHD